MKQIITLGPTGSISGLQVKPGKGVNLQKFGRADTQRASDIKWNPDARNGQGGWFIHVLRGKYAGQDITVDMVAVARKVEVYEGNPGDLAYYADYDEAVAAEIDVLDHIRVTEGAEALG